MKRLQECIYYARDLGDTVSFCELLCYWLTSLISNGQVEQRNTIVRGRMKAFTSAECTQEYGLVADSEDTVRRVGKLTKKLAYIYPGNIMTVRRKCYMCIVC